MRLSKMKVTPQWMRRFLFVTCILFSIFTSSVAFSATHTAILKVTNPNSTVSDTTVLGSDGSVWTQVYVEIPALLYMQKGWLDSDLDNLRFIDVDSGNIALSHWVPPKADNNLQINHLGIWLLVRDLAAGETETIKIEMEDGGSFLANPRASVGDQTHDRTEYVAASTVFPFYGYDSWEWKWNNTNVPNPYTANTEFIDHTLYSEDDLWGDAKSDANAKTGNEFTITIHNMKFYTVTNSSAQIYFLSQAAYNQPANLNTSLGYRLYLDDYASASDDLHYTRNQFTIKLQEYDGANWVTKAQTQWQPYGNSRHIFDIKVSSGEIFLVINGRQYDFTAVSGAVSSGKYQRTDSLISGHFGYDRMLWRLCCGSDINFFTVRRFLDQEATYEVYGNADLIITDTAAASTLGQDVTEIAPDLQQFSRAVGGNTLEDYIFATYAIARSNQIIDTYQVELENRSTSASETFTWTTHNSDPSKWIVYYCDSSGNNCSQTAPSATTLAQGASTTYTIKFVPTLSALVNGSTAHLTLAVEGQGDGSFDNVRFSASTFGNLGCFWEYKAQQVVTWPGGHGYDDLLDYQVPINLTGETDLQYARADGSDIVITDDHNNILEFWIKSFDRTAGNLAAWVKVPTLTGSSGDDNLYVWWGNSNHATSRSDQQATFDLFEDWESDYADEGKVGCDDGTTTSNVIGSQTIATNANLAIKSSCEGAAVDPHAWGNIPTPDDFYNWWEVDSIGGSNILQADVSSVHKSGDKGPFLHRGGLGWDHYEVSYKIYTGTYSQYGGGGTFGNPQYNPVYMNDAGNMWGMEYFADKFIFRPYAAGIDYTWQYQTHATNLLGGSFPQNDRWYSAKVRIFKDKSNGESTLKLYMSDPETDPANLPDVDGNAGYTEIADFTAPPAFSLDYGGIGFGGWDSGFGFDDVRVRKYTEDSSGAEPSVANSTVTTNTVRPELTLASPQITAPIFAGRPAYIEIKATPFSWRGDFLAYYADCYVNGECETGEDNAHIGTISVFGQVDADTAKGAGFALMERDPGENNATVATPTDRTIYTTDGSSAALLDFEIDECSTLQSDLGTIGSCDPVDGTFDETENLIRFVRGYYVADAAFTRSGNRNFDAAVSSLGIGYGNNDGIADPDEQWKVADALHSNPLLIGVPNMVYGYPDYWSDYVDVQDSRDLAAYFMTNDGMLHAIQLAEVGGGGYYVPTSEAKELWAFIPHAALPKLKETMGADHEYVADGLLRAIDIKVDTGDGQGEVWRTVLFGIGGRENTYVFGMDVTDPENPVLIWEMDADPAGSIGTTISAPALGRIDSDNDGNLDKWVAVVGSGYDLNYLDNYETSTAWLTVIDLSNGGILKQLQVSDKVGNALTDMAVLRNATTGAIDKLYFGDYYGALWRVTGDRIGRTDGSAPLADGDTLSDTVDVSHPYCDLLYKPTDYATTSVPDDPDYPIVAQPRIAKGENNNEYWVYFGSGDYDEYDASYPYQSFFGLEDKFNTAAPYEFADLNDMTFSTGTGTTSSWYIQMGKDADSTLGQADIDFVNNTTSGATSTKDRNERVMKRAEVYGGFVFFTTYEPLDVPCGGGTSRFYAVNYRTGAFETSLFLNLEDSSGNSIDNVRSVELETGGVPSQPMIMEGQSGGGTAVASGVTTSSSGGIEKVELNPQAFSTAMDILLWREKR